MIAVIGFELAQILRKLPTSSLPNLISQLLINQQGFDVDFGEHGQRMACS